MWEEENNSLKKAFIFKNFKEAFAFMTEVAAVAEDLDHHPEWTNIYNKVSFKLYTFAGNKVTTRDRKLAQAIDRVAEKYLEY
nr:4a-hydroxytetrahydrobiopterin dehydratase [Adhaeribacter aquaticus]